MVNLKKIRALCAETERGTEQQKREFMRALYNIARAELALQQTTLQRWGNGQ